MNAAPKPFLPGIELRFAPGSSNVTEASLRFMEQQYVLAAMGLARVESTVLSIDQRSISPISVLSNGSAKPGFFEPKLAFGRQLGAKCSASKLFEIEDSKFPRLDG